MTNTRNPENRQSRSDMIAEIVFAESQLSDVDVDWLAGVLNRTSGKVLRQRVARCRRSLAVA